MSYTIHLQKTKTGGHRVVLVSDENKKLVMQGESMKNKMDAEHLLDTLLGCMNSKWPMVRMGSTLKADHKFTKNAGPKKKAAKKAATNKK